jgi:alpha-D-ribose 1-methylphosphonate 5-triphosphate synthase subunit PhnI
VSEPVNTAEMRLERRISAVYKDIPGGQLLGPTYDYTHRLLDFTLLANGETPRLSTSDAEQEPSPHVFSLLANRGWRKRKKIPARSRMTSPARRRFTRARARRACSS